MPAIPGFEGHSVAVFEVVDVQENATALSRLAEYFIETQHPNEAAAVAITLEKTFPNDLGGMVARAMVATALEDPDRLAAAMQELTRMKPADIASSLPWDQRINLAIVLAQTQHMDLARAHLQPCVDEITDANLRFLTPASLYRFLLLCRATGIEITNPAMRALSRQLLAPELRNRI